MPCAHLHHRRSHSLLPWCHGPGASPRGAGHPLPQRAAAAGPAGCPTGAAEPGRASAHTWPGSSAPSPPCQMGHCHRWVNLPGLHVQRGTHASTVTPSAPRVSSERLSHTGMPRIAPLQAPPLLCPPRARLSLGLCHTAPDRCLRHTCPTAPPYSSLRTLCTYVHACTAAASHTQTPHLSLCKGTPTPLC